MCVVVVTVLMIVMVITVDVVVTGGCSVLSYLADFGHVDGVVEQLVAIELPSGGVITV
jgi:hypothetical protein